ncbi:hypothetical protein [Tsukamurella pseudospumae]|uniref:Uncharacterized protein n=1 Tax=Tsukamurella pseudospumae TaxID=239498 RepID=A0A138AU30_9ACTN|nr:hypothetical protein [Tsukamurella pseudospumae]KXP13919.1 hypothetical protein AXK60_22715 [Tsukamurella pseudospumae]
MSLRRFVTKSELTEQLPALADHIWSAAAPTRDEHGVETPSADPIFAGTFVPAEGGMEAEINITRIIARLDAFKAELRKVR